MQHRYAYVVGMNVVASLPMLDTAGSEMGQIMALTG